MYRIYAAEYRKTGHSDPMRNYRFRIDCDLHLCGNYQMDHEARGGLGDSHGNPAVPLRARMDP